MSISASEFLKWVSVFNLTEGGVTPGEVTLQLAYNGGRTITMAAASPIAVNTNVGLEVLQIADNGVHTHFPLYHFESDENLVLSSTNIDQIYMNDTSETANSVNIQDETSGQLYADNATFYVWCRDPTNQITINAAGAATIDGAASITPAAGQGLKITRISLNAWLSDQLIINNNVFNGLVAGAGVTITQDSEGRSVIALSGSGATAAYNYFSGTGVSSQISFNDAGHYFIPFSSNLPPPVTRGVNLAPYMDGNTHMGIQNVGTETGVFTIITKCQFEYGATNSNSNPNNYMMCGCIGNPNPPPGPGGSFAPIDLISSPYSSYSDKQFTVYPGIVADVVFPVQVQLAPDQVYYPLVRNVGPSNNPSLNNLTMPFFSFTTLKAGDTGGESAGVTSWNSLTGDVQLTSSDGTITYAVNSVDNLVTSSVNLPAGFYAPSVSILQGASSVVVQSASFDSTSPNAGGRVSCNAVIDVAIDGSNSIILLLLPGPIAENFTVTSQAGPVGFGILPLSGIGAPGNIGSGWFNQLYAYTAGPNASILFFEAATPSITYRINVAWSYIIQPAPLLLKAQKKQDLIYSGMNLCSPEFKKILEDQRTRLKRK